MDLVEDHQEVAVRLGRGKYILFIYCLLLSVVAPASEKNTEKPRSLVGMFKEYPKSKFNFFPVPVFETNPGSGQRYGIMPTFLVFDEHEELTTIALAAFTYNPSIVKYGGFAGMYVYPSPLENMYVFVQRATHFEEDFDIHYQNESWLDEKLGFEAKGEYYVNPFERFFGYGYSTPKSAETNFISHVALGYGRMAYEIFPHIDIQLEESWIRMRPHDHAIPSLADSVSTYGADSTVGASNILTHTISAVFDSRDSHDIPTKGSQAKLYLTLAHNASNTENQYGGYGLSASTIARHNHRLATVFGFNMDQLFGGHIPFFMQNKLGGDHYLRGFVDRRYVDKNRILFDIEERILVHHVNLYGTPFDFSIDPYVSLGQVFRSWSQVRGDNMQPVGGIGFRALVPPSVVGRVDVGVGRDGIVAFTSLNYPF